MGLEDDSFPFWDSFLADVMLVSGRVHVEKILLQIPIKSCFGESNVLFGKHYGKQNVTPAVVFAFFGNARQCRLGL